MARSKRKDLHLRWPLASQMHSSLSLHSRERSVIMIYIYNTQLFAQRRRGDPSMYPSNPYSSCQKKQANNGVLGFHLTSPAQIRGRFFFWDGLGKHQILMVWDWAQKHILNEVPSLFLGLQSFQGRVSGCFHIMMKPLHYFYRSK